MESRADLGDHIELDEEQPHSIEAVIDSFIVGPGIDQQVVTSLEHGLKLGDGLLGFHIVKPKRLGGEHKKFYDGYGCAPASACRRRDAPGPVHVQRPGGRLSNLLGHRHGNARASVAAHA